MNRNQGSKTHVLHSTLQTSLCCIGLVGHLFCKCDEMCLSWVFYCQCDTTQMCVVLLHDWLKQISLQHNQSEVPRSGSWRMSSAWNFSAQSCSDIILQGSYVVMASWNAICFLRPLVSRFKYFLINNIISPDFGPVLLVSRLESENKSPGYIYNRRSLPFLVESTFSQCNFKYVVFVWAILQLTLNVSSQAPVCYCYLV